MKKLYYGLFVVFCSTLFFASCSDDEGENDDVINGLIYGTWYNVRDYGEYEDEAWEDDQTDSSLPLYYAFYEDGTGKRLEGVPEDFTWTCDGSNLTISYLSISYQKSYQRGRVDNWYIRKLTADELELYGEDSERWWCNVFVRVDKEL